MTAVEAKADTTAYMNLQAEWRTYRSIRWWGVAAVYLALACAMVHSWANCGVWIFQSRMVFVSASLLERFAGERLRLEKQKHEMEMRKSEIPLGGDRHRPIPARARPTRRHGR